MERELRDERIDNQRLEIIGKASIFTFLSILLITLLLCIITKNRGNCSFAIWQNITYLQLIRWLGLINVDDESEFEAFFEEFSLIFRPFRLPSVCLDESIDSKSYKTMQIESNGFINNAKEILLIYLTVMIFCVVALISNKVSQGNRFSSLVKKIKFSIIIRLHLLLFMDFMMFSMINIAFFDSGNTCSTVNLGLSIFFLILGGFWIIQIPLLIKKKLASNLEENFDVIFESIDTIVSEFQPTFRTVTYQYYTIFLLYRLSLAFCLIVLGSSPSVQLFMIASFQVMTSKEYLVFYILKVKPYKSRTDSFSVFACEFLSLILVIFIGIRSLDLGPNSKYYLSVFCVFLIWLTEAVIVGRFGFAILLRSENHTRTTALDETSPQVVTEHVPQNSVAALKSENGNQRLGLNSYSIKGITGRQNNDVFVDAPRETPHQNTENGENPVRRRKVNLNSVTVKKDIRGNSQNSKLSTPYPYAARSQAGNSYATTGHLSHSGTKDIKTMFKFDDDEFDRKGKD